MRSVTFYRSAICPRCHMAGRSLAKLLPEFPEVTIEVVEILTNGQRARTDGVRRIPTLLSGDRRLSGFYLTRARIRRFLESL
jgi:glutaredoxin